MAKLISPKAELTAIYHVCNGKQEVSTRLIAKLSENHFGHSPAQAAWRRLMSLAKSRGRIPDYYALCEDTTLSNDDIRQLKDFEPNRKVKTLEDASDLVETLENHRLLRSQYKLAEDIYEHLDGDEVDPTSFLTQIELAMGEMRSSRSAEDLIVQFGLDSNIGPLIESVLDQDEKPDYIPTGFKTWDSVNGGVPLGSLFVIAGTTGGGKSVLASVQLLVNMSSYAPVCLEFDSLVETPTGFVKIQEVLVGTEVYSYNTLTKKREIKPITGVMSTPAQSKGKLIRITHEGGSFVCTKDHKIWVDDIGDYVEAQYLKPGVKLTTLD